jgi:transcriptional regulator with GAF, ATPase, and Fis domain
MQHRVATDDLALVVPFGINPGMSLSPGIEETLGRVSLRMTSTLELDAVLAEITRGLVLELQAALARIWLLGPGDLCAECALASSCPDRAQCLHLAASAGLEERTSGSHRRVPVGALKIGQIAALRAAVCIHDLASDPRIVDQDWVAREGLLSFAGYPLDFRGEVLGVLAIFARHRLGEGEVERLGIFAAQASVAIKNARLFEEVSQLSRRLEAENSDLKEELHGKGSSGLLGTSAALARVRREVEQVAPTDASVLLQGETGTGKELLARAIHDLSPRRARPLVKVNCAAIVPTLIESELFGHEKGAFTGALARRIGRFELAQGGTLFLDEVGELPLEAQAKLLRVIQERELERVGGTSSIPFDVRIVSATNRNLAVAVREQRFRADLLYRLRVFPIHVPPLRERREDIALLAAAFVQALGKRLHRELEGIDESAMRVLCAYDWPGNVRELQNVLERAAILASSPRITVSDLPDLGVSTDENVSSSGIGVADVHGSRISLRQRVDAYERALVIDALRLAEGNQSEAARQLGMSRATLQYKMKAHRL